MADSRIATHYARADLAAAILAALTRAGKDVGALKLSDLAPIDAFHVRGAEATRELAGLLNPSKNDHVLDVGCAIGGSARYLASQFGCRVTGIDLSADYCAAGNMLNERVGMAERIALQQGSALDLPFAGATFDAVWTEHVQMNIADKARLYREIRRVLKPAGRFAFHDILAGPLAAGHFPVPWAADPSMSFLIEPGALRALLESLGFSVGEWIDVTDRAREWFRATADRTKAAAPSPLGLQLLMGPDAALKVQNLARNTLEDRLRFVEAVIRCPAQ